MEVLAKRYVKAILQTWDEAGIQGLVRSFDFVAQGLKDSSSGLKNIFNSPYLSREKKLSLLESLMQQGLGSEKLDQKTHNLLRLLIEHSRVDLIPFIQRKLDETISVKKREFLAVIYTSSPLEPALMDRIKQSLSRHFDVKLELQESLWQRDEIKLVIDGIGVEVSFSNKVFCKNLKAHILNAV